MPMFRRSPPSWLASSLGLLTAITATCAHGGGERPRTIRFHDVAQAAGVDFRFSQGTRGRHDLPEIMGGGVALIDVDSDGWLDIFFCNGGPIVRADGAEDPPCRLYRSNRGRSFTDITATAGAPGPSYAMGTAVGDFDGDGRDDLFVTGWGDQRLYRNRGGGRFDDVTDRAGLASRFWSTAAAFADLDRDGDLDLFVVNYLRYDPAHAPFCSAPDGARDYCGPEDFEPEPDRLYRNNGDGTFTDVSAEAGVAGPGGAGLGLLIADLTGDPRPDIYVANDGTASRLFENLGGLRFRDVGDAAGVAVDGQGRALSGMGVAQGDLDGDGLPDLAVSNFLGRSTVLFQALGDGRFVDRSLASGVGRATRDVLGFGIALEDFDGDGRIDLLQANGHVLDRARLGTPLAMRPTLLRNDGGRLGDAADRAGPRFAQPVVGRGLATGDLNGDGKPDAVVVALDAPAAILRNETADAQFLALELIPRRGADAVGARVVATVAGRAVRRGVSAGGSYLSTSDRRVYLGLGDAADAARVEVTWPSGHTNVWTSLKPGKVHRLEEGGR